MPTLVTDSSRRDGAIQRFMWSAASPDSEHIVFEPTRFDGLPDQAEVGAGYQVSIHDVLTIHGLIQSGSLSGRLNLVSQQLEGQLSTGVRWRDFGIFRPQVPRLTRLDKVVLLTIDFVARGQAR